MRKRGYGHVRPHGWHTGLFTTCNKTIIVDLKLPPFQMADSRLQTSLLFVRDLALLTSACAPVIIS